jgi:hypothetical protein
MLGFNLTLLFLSFFFFFTGCAITLDFNVVPHGHKQIILFLLEASNQLLQLIVLLVHFI